MLGPDRPAVRSSVCAKADRQILPCFATAVPIVLFSPVLAITRFEGIVPTWPLSVGRVAPPVRAVNLRDGVEAQPPGPEV